MLNDNQPDQFKAQSGNELSRYSQQQQHRKKLEQQAHRNRRPKSTAERHRELTAELIDLLQRRYPTSVPAWVHRAVDRLILADERLAAITAELA